MNASKLATIHLRLKETAQAFSHKDEEKRGEGVSLPEAPRRLKSVVRGSIQENAEESGGNEPHDPVHPVLVEPVGH